MSQSNQTQTVNTSVKREKTGFSLQTRLVLFVLLVALVPLIIITTRDTLQTQRALTNEAEVSLKSGAAKERAIFESTTRIGSTLNIENILQAAAEVEKVLGRAEVTLQFQSDNGQKPEK